MSVVALASAGLAGAGMYQASASTAASAGTAADASTGADASSAGVVSTAGVVSPEQVNYTCSLAPYGQSLPPLTLPARLSAASTGSAVVVKLVTRSVQLPTAAATAMPRLNYLDVAGSAPTTGMSGSDVSLGGHSAYQTTAASGLMWLPSVTAAGAISMAGTGAAATPAVTVPHMITLTPITGAAKASLTCTTSSAATVQVAVAAMAAASMQPYNCTITVGTSSTTANQVPWRLVATPPYSTGSRGAVTLSAPVSALGSAFPSQATPMSITGSAPVSGGNTGSIPLTGLTDAGTGSFRLTGHWVPRTAGLTRIFAPYKFAAHLKQQSATTVAVATTAAVACTAVSATTTSTQVMVNTSPGAAAVSVSASAAPSASTAMSSAPAGAAPGAPNTGGGGSLHSANDLPLAAGGAAAIVAGITVTDYAIKRRRGLIPLSAECARRQPKKKGDSPHGTPASRETSPETSRETQQAEPPAQPATRASAFRSPLVLGSAAGLG
ncbi:MAG TPA: hypothetical protein VF070_41505 [Streptosporangiaceae bacterium]